jgi:Fanconi-associated nuclease 1
MEAKLICQEALSDHFVLTSHKSSIFKRLAKLSKIKNKKRYLVSYQLPPHDRIPCKTIFATRIDNEKGRVHYLSNGGLVTPEELALGYFQENGYNGYHSENSIITTLFGLLFWDIIFDDKVPGVFSSMFQFCPLDMNTVYFYTSRKNEIDKRITEIEAGKGPSIIKAVYEKEGSKGAICIGVNWKKFNLQDICEISNCIGSIALARVCELFAKSYWAHRGL